MAGALPGPATALALRAPADPSLADAIETMRGAARLWIIALGKAAHAMTVAAVESLDASRIAGGLLVSTQEFAPPLEQIAAVAGDHPIPGEASRRAAGMLDALTARVAADDAVLVLLSGGTSSLVGAPIAGVDAVDLRALNEQLLGSGLDIVAMNGVRKRFSRWGAGRLAAALAPARVLCLVVSDVVGDDLAAIGSGPCVPDALTASDVEGLLRDARLLAHLPASCQSYLRAVTDGRAPDTPKPDSPAFDGVHATVIVGSEHVLDAPADEARRLGWQVHAASAPLTGDAAACGRRLASELRAARPGSCLLWRGETTVRLTGDAPPGGRCQELALAAAAALVGSSHPITLLAAGTDGRDGPTDAAGACVDTTTWDAMARAGIDSAEALRRHDSYRALDAVGALIRTAPSGTNVGDVVVGLVG